MNFYNLPKGICSVVVGCACASLVDGFEIVPCVLALIFVVFLQITVNLQNNYCELYYHKSRVLDVGLSGRLIEMSPNDVYSLKVVSFMFMILTATVGLGLAVIGGWPAILIGVLIFSALYFYNATRYAIRFSRWAPFVIFFFFGPLAVFGCFFLETFHDLRDPYTPVEIYLPIFMGCVMGFYAVNVWLVRERMRVAILPTKSKHFASRATPESIRRMLLFNIIAIFVLQAGLCFAVGLTNPWIVLTLPIICLIGNLLELRKVEGVYKDVSAYRVLTIYGLANMILYTVGCVVYQIYII